MARCSPCSPCPSEAAAGRWTGGSVRAALIVVAVALGPLAAGRPAPASGSASGTVAGTVAVEQAHLRTDGPKHDRDVILYLEPAAGGTAPASDAHAAMDQRGLVFIPHVLTVQRGTTVTFLNNDNDQHNVYFLFDKTGETLDIGTWGPGVSVDHRFEDSGEVIVLCKLHLEMAAYILVVDGPLFVQTELDPSGSRATFSIPNVPQGEYTLRAWHKKLKQKGGAARVAVTGGGRTEVDVVIAKRP